ncbi:hypothetical protein AC070_03160 [Fannyhessea vaginae]|uniref:hypothetical protein n=1 Tax=Fannyhessea vaginae TaxID=82135 RepID=UPI00065DDECA|nr:hypothetical protein [Fannyhessea vaginae]KMT47703.1 hypothetical protein AC070_03160 [Fannyhessea vaginae]
MTDEELNALVQETLEERRKSRCIVLNYAEAEEAYNALMGMREKLKKICKRAEKFKSDDSFKLYEQLSTRLETMNKLIERLEKKLTTR